MALEDPVLLPDGTKVAKGTPRANVTWNRWFHTIANALQGSASAANAGQVSGTVNNGSGAALTVKRANVVVAASQANASLVALVAGKKIRVLAAKADSGSTATSFTFRSKPAGTGTDIAGPFTNPSDGTSDFNYNPQGWFETVAGEALTVTTGTGASTTFLIDYIEA